MEQLWIDGTRNLPKVKMLTWTSRLYTETIQNVWSALATTGKPKGKAWRVMENQNKFCGFKKENSYTTIVVIWQKNATYRILSA